MNSKRRHNVLSKRWYKAMGLFVCILGMFGTPLVSFAQSNEASRYTLVLRQVTVEEALEELVALTKINLVYDPTLLTDSRIFCDARGDTAENILRCITTEAGLDFYRLSSGTYVLTELAQTPPRYGGLAGIVVDKETGEPLPYANVLLADASTGVAANDAGMFTFTSLLSGPHAIVATYVGYESAVDSVWIPPDGVVRHRIELESSAIVSEPIVVNGLQQRLPSWDLGAGRTSEADFQSGGNAGAADVIYSLNSIMSVGLRAPFVDLHIQGGESSENVMLLDGVPVFEPVSLGSMLGAFSPLAIGRLTVHKAGFGASIGSRLSSVLYAEHRLNASPRQNITLQVDPLSINGRIEASIDMKGSASSQFMIAGRSSIWNAYKSDVLDGLLRDWNSVDPLLTSTVLGTPTDALRFTPHRHGSDVNFSDLHGAGQIQLDPFHKLSLSYYRGTNNIATELLTAESANVQDVALIVLSRDRYAWSNEIAQIRYEWLMGARTLGAVKLRNSVHHLNHNYQMADSQSAELPVGLDTPAIEQGLRDFIDVSGSPEDRNRLLETALEMSLDYSLSRNHQLLTGFEFARITNQFSLDNPFFEPLDLGFSDWRTAGFIEDRISIGLQTTIEAGSRFTYIPNRSKIYAEPRLALRHDASAPLIGSYSIHLAAGIYRQFINQFDLSNPGPSAAVPYLNLWLPIDESIAPPKAYHLTGNLLIVPRDNWTIRLETYYKKQPHLVALNYHPMLVSGEIDVSDENTEDDFIGNASGYAYGGGVFLERKGRRSVASLQYSYSVSRRRFPGRFDDRLETTPWNEPHRLTLAQDFFITSGLTTRLRAHGIWGRAWGFRRSYYDYLAAHAKPGQYDPFDLTHPSGDRLPPYYQIDAGIAYEREIAGVSVQVRADAINLLNRRNVVDWSLSRTTDTLLEKTERVLPGAAAAFSLRVRY